MRVGADRHEGARKGGAKVVIRRKYNGPPKDEPWLWLTRELINSEAFRALSGNAMKIVMRVGEEHMAHGGTDNGKLLVTHKQFAAYGIRLASVAEAIREAEFFGFLAVDRGMAYKGGHEPNLYRLTWLGCHNGFAPTNQWKGIGDQHVKVWRERRAVKVLGKKNRLSRSRETTSTVIQLRG
ncbi:hypothetical protein ASG50_17940 [Rhizobium sp. Leaf386]|nr:hypothetical protein ASG50_17940 [Rhizobium sp. Leaf386]